MGAKNPGFLIREIEYSGTQFQRNNYKTKALQTTTPPDKVHSFMHIADFMRRMAICMSVKITEQFVMYCSYVGM